MVKKLPHTQLPEGFQTVFAQSPVSIQVFSPDGLTIMVNKAWEEMWRIKPKDILYVYNILQDKQLIANNLMPYIKEAFVGKKKYLPTIKYEPDKTVPGVSDVKYRWVSAVIYPLKDRKGNVQYVVLQHADVTKEFDAKENLQASEERFRQLLEHSVSAITLVDQKGMRLYSTPSRKKVLGYINHDVGKSVFEYMHPEDKVNVQRVFAEIAAKPGQSRTMEFRYRHKKGNWVWLEATGTNLLHVPHVEAIVINYHDITERKLAAEALKQSEEKFRTLFDSNIIGIFISTLDGQFLEANDVFLHMVGYTKKELYTGKVHRDKLTAPGFEYLTKEAIQSLQAKGSSTSYEKEYVRKDGSRFPVLLAVARVEKTDICIGYALDITDRKKSEEANYKLAALITSSDDAIVSKDLKGTITSWNGGAEKLFGYTAQEAVGKHIFLIIPPDRKDEELDILKKISKGERIQHFRTLRKRKDGSLVPVSLTISPVKDSKGKIIGASKIARDITEQLRVEQEKSDFLSMASHELKTPLTSMKMFLELLGRQLDTTELHQAKYFVNRIQDQTNQLVELTNDLLDVSRIETGKLRLNKEPFHLNDLISETVEALATSTRSHKLVLVKNPPTLIHADRYRIFQVLINLLTNAIKYSPSGRDIHITLDQKDSIATVRVQDFGIGIKKSQQEKIFDKLYQVTDPQEKTYPGLGLGLYISKEIIERHKGTIQVQSAKGKGSTFSFSLPLEEK